MNTISVFKECSLGVKTDVKGEPCNAAGEVGDKAGSWRPRHGDLTWPPCEG